MAAVPVYDEHISAASDPSSDEEELHVHDPAAPEGEGSSHDGLVRCPECAKPFKNKQSMFGHLRSHPNKGYKGASPHALRGTPKIPPSGADHAPPAADADEAIRSAGGLSSLEIFVAFVLLLLKDDDGRASECARSTSSTKRKIEPSDDNTDGDINKDSAADPTGAELGGKKKSRRKKAGKEGSAQVDGYECKTCKQVFPTYQALGGHMAGHKKDKQNRINGYSSKCECSDGAATTGRGPKGEQHVCKVCRKEFYSGQALGGHMRHHFEKKEQPSPALEAVHRGHDIDHNIEAPE